MKTVTESVMQYLDKEERNKKKEEIYANFNDSMNVISKE